MHLVLSNAHSSSACARELAFAHRNQPDIQESNQQRKKQQQADLRLGLLGLLLFRCLILFFISISVNLLDG